VRHARSHFMSGGAPGHGEASPGDHLQTLYHYWLVGHQLEHGRAPWRDPYTFQPEAKPQPNYAGWPFGFLFWPLGTAFGLVAGWNLLQLLVYVLAGLFACAWLRELGLPRGPALVGGLVFAIAPYRVQQSVGHVLGPISILLPLSLWAFECGWLWLYVAALASIPLSGQVHLALGVIPFAFAYALVRRRDRRAVVGAAVGALAAIGTGLLVRETLIKGSTEAGGRKLAEITRYSAHFGDLFARDLDHGRSEQFIFLGWLTPLLALAGVVLLLRARRYGLAALLALGVVVPVVLALGTNTPIYSPLWHALPPFRFPRVPERLLPIACLCLAALVAFALARARVAVIAVVIALVFVDLHVQVYRESDVGHPARAAYHGPGRLLELPLFDPSVHYGSVYLWYDTAAHRERPEGYATTAPRAAKRIYDRLQRLNCGDWSDGTAALLDKLGVRAIALHLGLYDRVGTNSAWFALQSLDEHGWHVQRSAGPVLLLERKSGSTPSLQAPNPTVPYFCQGWYGDTGNGRYMSETHAPFWVQGTVYNIVVKKMGLDPHIDVHPGPDDWNLVTIDVPHLTRVPGVKPRVGAKLVRADAATSGKRSTP
jgi:hypothetical protein